jgi:hypothetical protein
MIRFHHRLALAGGVLAALTATAAIADTTLQFTVPVTITLPASYNGPRTLTVDCAVGAANLQFDPATGTASEGGRPIPAAPAATIQMTTLRSAIGSAASGAGAGKGAGAGETLTGNAAFTLKINGTLGAPGAAGVSSVVTTTTHPTDYICWGLVGTNSAYATPPFVKGKLPEIAK